MKKMTAKEITEKYCNKCKYIENCETKKIWATCIYAKMMK